MPFLLSRLMSWLNCLHGYIVEWYCVVGRQRTCRWIRISICYTLNLWKYFICYRPLKTYTNATPIIDGPSSSLTNFRILFVLTWLVFPLLWVFRHFRHLIVTKLIVTTSSRPKAITNRILLFEKPRSIPRMKFRIFGEYSVAIWDGSYCNLTPSLVLSKGWRTATRGTSESVE